jgi:hypothetical protein
MYMCFKLLVLKGKCLSVHEPVSLFRERELKDLSLSVGDHVYSSMLLYST